MRTTLKIRIMETANIIALVGVLIGLGQLVYAIRSHSLQQKTSGTGPTRTVEFKKIELEWRVPKWVLRVGLFLFQLVAIYFVVEQYNSVEPVTRSSVVVIASLVAVWGVTFVLQQVIGVYDYIEAHYK